MNETMKRRHPWLASILSLLTPGLGQLYSRRPTRAVVWFLIAMVSSAAYLVLRATGIFAESPRGMFGWLIAAVVIWIIGIVDAWRSARQASSVPLAWYNRWYVYLLVILVMGFPALVPAPKEAGEAFSMPSGSMIPTLVVGDIFEVSTTAYRSSPPQPGDVVVVKKSDGGRSFVKRVIGVAGDHVQMKEGRLYVNGALVAREALGEFTDPGNGTGSAVLTHYRETLPDGRSYQIVELSDHEYFDNTPEFLVPPDQLFVMGDNRDSSMDSRAPGEFGFVPVDMVIGRVTFISGSLDPRRIGTKID